MTNIFAGQRIALLTQHGKERVIAPVLEPNLGCKVELVSGYDTDQLGTFTRDTPRLGSQVEAARRKARIGMELSGLPVGLASEGSFGPDPVTGLFPWNVEVLILIDDRIGLEVVALAQGAALSGHLHSDEWEAVEQFARQHEFPGHQLVIRPGHQNDPRITKGIGDWAHLRHCFEDCKAKSINGKVFVEADLRAFANPTRMKRIGEAAEDLLQRIQSQCPACQRPGFWVVERHPGLPCAVCATPTKNYKSEVSECPSCRHRSTRIRQDRRFADPEHCPRCNP